MSVSWYEKVREFKSPLHVIAAVLLRSRETQLEKCSQLSQQVENAVIVSIVCDRGDRYLSTGVFPN